jgi:hypothetical protein
VTRRWTWYLEHIGIGPESDSGRGTTCERDLQADCRTRLQRLSSGRRLVVVEPREQCAWRRDQHSQALRRSEDPELEMRRPYR